MQVRTLGGHLTCHDVNPILSVGEWLLSGLRRDARIGDGDRLRRHAHRGFARITNGIPRRQPEQTQAERRQYRRAHGAWEPRRADATRNRAQRIQRVQRAVRGTAHVRLPAGDLELAAGLCRQPHIPAVRRIQHSRDPFERVRVSADVTMPSTTSSCSASTSPRHRHAVPNSSRALASPLPRARTRGGRGGCLRRRYPACAGARVSGLPEDDVDAPVVERRMGRRCGVISGTGGDRSARRACSDRSGFRQLRARADRAPPDESLPSTRSNRITARSASASTSQWP